MLQPSPRPGVRSTLPLSRTGSFDPPERTPTSDSLHAAYAILGCRRRACISYSLSYSAVSHRIIHRMRVVRGARCQMPNAKCSRGRGLFREDAKSFRWPGNGMEARPVLDTGRNIAQPGNHIGFYIVLHFYLGLFSCCTPPHSRQPLCAVSIRVLHYYMGLSSKARQVHSQITGIAAHRKGRSVAKIQGLICTRSIEVPLLH